MNGIFGRVAQAVADHAGRPYAFIAAVGVVVIWAVSGPIFHYSDTWQLVINTGTTIVTFLMVFLIQNSQNRDTRALHLKLDELIRVTSHAENRFINLEDHAEEELLELKRSFDRVCNEPGKETPARN